MKTLRVVILAGAAIALATSAFAQSPSAAKTENSAIEKTAKSERGVRREGMPLARLDINKDGAVDLAEFSSVDRLKKADTNGDGTLSQDEITAMVEKANVTRQVERATRRLDVDGDGTVTLAEVEKQKAKRFAVMDRNNDGKIEKAELRSGKHDRKHKAD